MIPIKRNLVAMTAVLTLVMGVGCSDRNPTDLEPAQGNTDPLVFGDDYGADVYYQGFFQTYYTAVTIDSTFAAPLGAFAFDGARSLEFRVAPVGAALGGYTGGVLTSGGNRDLADYNALTFYARANDPVTVAKFGFGNDNTGASLYTAERGGVALNSDWTFVVVPIPAPSKLRAERGLFTIVADTTAAYPEGYDIWVDEIKFAKLDNIEIFRANLPSANKQLFVGSPVVLSGTNTIFKMGTALIPVSHMAGYFDFSSSDPGVARVTGGDIEVVGTGTASITATLEGAAVNGSVTVTGYSPPNGAAVSPPLPASDVISMFSDAYPSVPVDTWRADWGGSTAQLGDFQVAGDNTKMYSSLNFVGILFHNPLIDASAMTHFHMDVYAPAGTNFKIKLISFPPGLGHSVETTDLVLNGTTTPAFHAGSWSSLDIPLENFQLPASWDWSEVGEMAFSTTDAQLVLVDNVYWHK